MEVMSMFETRTKKWEESIFEKGIEKGIEKGMEKRALEITERMIKNGMSNADIRKITGISLNKIEVIRKHKRSSR
jgi:predicted transposase/invertase (TIGR01784 family)